ncbi:hypothetical protein TKK_0008682 [Trichogramma kaykai]|uniref:Ionotropic glutamate receptor C-terminal domain-containing protein n=1 Tax=Trichogramma kaykai TaxID=54128 RepID=A0ABD2X4D6_9HYME
MTNVLKQLVLYYFIVVLKKCSSYTILHPDFVIEYFQERNIEQIVIFACWDNYDVFNHLRGVQKGNKRVSYNEIQDDMRMDKILNVNYYKIGVILDLDCDGSLNTFKQFSSARLSFNESYNWLAVTAASEVPIKQLENLPLTIESELSVALVGSSSYVLYDVYNHAYRHGGLINVTSLGHWDASEGLKNQLTQYKYTRRQNFHGIPLNFSYVLINKPEPDLDTYLSTPINPHLDTMIRFHYALIMQLKDFYNFSIHLTKAKTWGYLINGSFTGILGEMINGTVDISVAPFQYKMERLDACEHTVETYVVKPWLIFRHPKKSNLRNPFLKPFRPNVWWLTLAVSITCWGVLLIIVKLEIHYKGKREQSLYTDAPSETALITFAAVSQQGLSDGPKVFSGRIVFITLFLWALMMYQFYSASIVGSILAPPARFIKNMRDLANSDLQVESEETPYIHDYFKTTIDPNGIYLWEKKLKPSPKKKTWTTTAKEGLERVKKGGWALFIDSATAYKIIEDTFTQSEICDLAEVELVSPRYVTIVTSKRSPFKKMVIYGLRKMVESGITSRLTNIWKHRRPACPESHRSKPVPVGMQEFSPAIFMIAGGLILATCVMLSEILTSMRRNSSQKFFCCNNAKFEETSEDTESNLSV